MPPVVTADPRPASSGVIHGRPTAGAHFRRALMLMLMTLVLPGSAQLVAGRKQVGRIALRIWLGLIVTVVLLLGLGHAVELVRVLAAQQHLRARAGPDRADRDGGRLGAAVHGRLAAGRPAGPAAEAAARDGRHQRGAVLQRRRHPAVRLPRRRRAEGLPQRDVHRWRGHRCDRRPLQRPAARRRLRLGPLGPAAGQHVGGEHRRRDRRDGALRPAAQHAELPLRQGLDHGRAVPRRLRLRQRVRAELTVHVGRGPQGTVQGRRRTPVSRRPAPRSRASPA